MTDAPMTQAEIEKAVGLAESIKMTVGDLPAAELNQEMRMARQLAKALHAQHEALVKLAREWDRDGDQRQGCAKAVLKELGEAES